MISEFGPWLLGPMYLGRASLQWKCALEAFLQLVDKKVPGIIYPKDPPQ
jgi:hypothetical protein